MFKQIVVREVQNSKWVRGVKQFQKDHGENQLASAMLIADKIPDANLKIGLATKNDIIHLHVWIEVYGNQIEVGLDDEGWEDYQTNIDLFIKKLNVSKKDKREMKKTVKKLRNQIGQTMISDFYQDMRDFCQYYY